MLAPSASSSFGLTNSFFKSHHFINKNHLQPCQCQCQCLTQNVSILRGTTRVSFMLLPSLQFRSCFVLHFLHKFPSPPLLYPMSSLNSEADPDAKTVRAVIKGRVQGVFYRDWTVENAKELGLKGWVRNRRDGSVEVLFSGSPERVQEMEQRCRRGPPSAIVTGFDVFLSDDDPGTGFERKQTA